MFLKPDELKSENCIQQHLRKAGYGEMTPLQKKVIPLIFQKKDILVETGDARGKTASYILPLLDKTFRGTGRPSAVIIAPGLETVRKIDRQWGIFGGSPRHPPRRVVLGITDAEDWEHRALAMKPHIVIGTAKRIIDHIRRGNITFDDLQTAVIDISEEQTEPGFDKDILFIFSKISRKIQTILYTKKGEEAAPFEEILKRPVAVSGVSPEEKTLSDDEQENETMSRKAPFSLNEKDLKNTLKDFIQRVKKEENPDELDAYKKIIRRNVPFTMRAYIGAYLLKEYTAKNPGSKEFITLFISIGKSKRIFPRDLTKLFCSTLNIPNSEIGSIKVLDNYSFLDISPQYADAAIETLNGSDFRGRHITVNHARKKGNEQ
ncbi:MAG: DbpA RNA binding domain-containing protein [Spirochaetales bacterium]|nr:DbpA RNA binding domain-containing protein [Spirochaetales bacterium]